MQGFIVFDYAKEYPVAIKQIGQWLGEGKLKRQETIIKGGIASSDEAFKQLFAGGNMGKWRRPREKSPEVENKLTPLV
jgi:NADPH-dependent curcumin reductase CurA